MNMGMGMCCNVCHGLIRCRDQASCPLRDTSATAVLSIPRNADTSSLRSFTVQYICGVYSKLYSSSGWLHRLAKDWK